MPHLNPPPPNSAGFSGVDENLIYAALGDPVRRTLLKLLSSGPPRTASQLAPNVARTRDMTAKHLAVLRAGGLVLMQTDGEDARCQVYLLPAWIKVTVGEKGTEMDFGCCTVRW